MLCSIWPFAHAAGPAWPTCRGATGEFGLGEIQFPNSGAAAAQKDFLRGLLLLHTFEYADARHAFRAAERIDPTFAMAYWGEALSYDETLWYEEDVASARAALVRLGATPEQRAAKAGTARERMYLASVEQLYGAGDKAQRDAHYSAALAALVQRYPHDLNARALYALSLLGLSNGVRNVRNYMRAAAQAEEVLQVDPCQPGALHYLIHATDDPVHAVLGLQAARRLLEVAPASEHAVHMASHIYMALGMWNEVIRTNLASVKIARADHMTAYHQMMFLIYAYLQENERKQAGKWIALIAHEAAAVPTRQGQSQSQDQNQGQSQDRSQDQSQGPGGNSPVTLANDAAGAAKDARTRLAYARAMWLVETRGAAGANARVAVDSRGVTSIGYFAAQDFARGISAGGDLAEARAALAQLHARIAAARAAPTAVKVAWLDTVTDQELTEATLMARALAGVIRYDQGDRAAGIAAVARAASAADQLSFEYGPPWSVKPLRELLGELLLGDGRRAEAAAEFEKTLAMFPNRRLTLQDLAAARSAH